MSRTILQIPMTKELRAKAEAVAQEYGFSSLQETVRVLLHKLSKKELKISFHEAREEKLSPEADRRYAQMIEDIKNGKPKTKSFENIDAMMKHLHSKT